MRINKVVFIVLLFGSIFLGFSQEKINQVDGSGKRTGVWKKFHENGRVRYVGNFENGKEVGTFYYYSALNSENPIIIKKFNKANFKATVQFFSVAGILESEGEMENENRINKWTYYYPDGKIMIEEFYKNGLLNGVYTSYFKNGKVSEKLTYKNGQLHGSAKRFADNGVLVDDLVYQNNKLNGLAKYYSINGKLIYTGTYENDEKVGHWEYFGEGEIIKTSENN